jgi:hypothetical protein
MTESIIESLFMRGLNHSLTNDGWDEVPFLKHLDLSQCEFDATGSSVNALCAGLKENVGLTKLKLENCQLEDDELADIVIALVSHPTLKELSLALNYAGSNTIEAVSKLLGTQRNEQQRLDHPVQVLERLDLGQQSPGHLQNLDLVYQALQHNNALKYLCLRENYLLRSQIPQLVQALRTNQTLEELNLEDCDLRKDGIELIIDNINHYRSLRKLWLRNNVTSRRDTVDVSGTLPSKLEANHVMHLLDYDEEWIPEPRRRQLVDFYLHLNRAGRCFLKSPDDLSLPLGMWPILLERVEKRLFYRKKENVGEEASSNTTSNGTRQGQGEKVPITVGGVCVHSTIFFLLQGPALCQR